MPGMTLKDTVPGHAAAAPETSALPGKRITVLDAKARELLYKVAENLEGAVEFLPVGSRKYFSGLAIEVRDLVNTVKEEILMSLEEARFEAMLEERVRVRTREKIASWFGLEMLSMSESDVALEVYAKRLQQIAQDGAQFSENWKAVVDAVNPDDPTIESVLENIEAMKDGIKENSKKPAPQNNSEHLQIDPISELCSSCGEKMIATLMRSEPKIVCDKGCRHSVASTFEPPCPSCKKNGKNGKLKFRSPSIGDMFLCDKCNFCLKSKRLFEQANRNKEQVDGMSQESILMAWAIEGKSSRCSAPNMSMKKFLKEDH